MWTQLTHPSLHSLETGGAKGGLGVQGPLIAWWDLRAAGGWGPGVRTQGLPEEWPGRGPGAWVLSRVWMGALYPAGQLQRLCGPLQAPRLNGPKGGLESWPGASAS